MSRENFTIDSLKSQDPSRVKQLLDTLSPNELLALEYDWKFWARPEQLAPQTRWSIWLILAGRGFGKTRTGAEWVIERVTDKRARRIAIVGETAKDVREVMIEGESGILARSPPWFRPKWNPSLSTLTWPNGAKGTTYSAEEPDQLRGPAHDTAWADEIAKWRYPDAWDQLMFGLRLGQSPQVIATTTPRPIPLIKKLLTNPACHPTRGSTYDNLDNLAPTFRELIISTYEGTRLGRQELNAEILDDVPGALWKRENILTVKPADLPDMLRIVIAIDPATTANERSDETGIVVCGLGTDGRGYVLADLSGKYSPDQWAKLAVQAFVDYEADRIIAEVNNGGDMVEKVIRTVNKDVPYRAVRASRGKVARAEPVAALYEQHRVSHLGTLPLLEDQMVIFVPDLVGQRSFKSPDRVDALVWGMTELMVTVIDDSLPMAAPISVPNNMPWRTEHVTRSS